MLSAAAPAGGEARTIALPTGILQLDVHSGSWELDALCGFAARNNPKRGFLVVSRVLGRHLPARPDAMRASARGLAALVPAGLPGPVLVFGLAETAVCLGQTVHEELRRMTARDDIYFLHSTRQRIGQPLLCRFEEPHSHASAHLVFAPAYAPPRSLVLVDDEVSTGSTLVNAARALVEAWPGVETIAAASLTDWSDGAWLMAMPRPACAVALLSGRLSWRPTVEMAPAPSFDSRAAALGMLGAGPNDGRSGLCAPICPKPISVPAADGPIRIIGTGEFTYPPFLLAEQLQRAGHDVAVQATSRSPARLGGAITTALRFRDNYGTGVPNYLYNIEPEDGRANWLCHETPEGSMDPTLVEALGANLVGWAQ